VTRSRDARVTTMSTLHVIDRFRRFHVARVRTPGRDPFLAARDGLDRARARARHENDETRSMTIRALIVVTRS
jgi:hypothetical protein